ncbi:Transmembrane and coiled-coil domain-containing protein 4 [Sesamum angolense]|uniref:Transmembrane and coiled-coil domain-containing protein 4 n=1 Tax=Sesamum angolense TaxID=2727404 RepID=A0AAE1XGN5_9LAMI|nr:Transmembrane and coiled-coil domain-containing protein 4 [Sesamum angolense]
MVVACSAMALLKEEESKEQCGSPESTWDKWKRGGIIGAAALTGGTLMAITGGMTLFIGLCCVTLMGLAAPAIAAGFGALAPTLGTIIPVIGASGFAAVASAAGSVAGSVAVAASFGAAGAGLSGTKMARRIGDVDEFEFKAIGENHNQGRLAVEISVSGFVFEEEDFIRPWEEQHDKLERYALQWESQHLIAVSTAIQDWLTSSIAREVMKRGAMMTVLGTLTAALVWPATLLSLTDFIDSKWTIAIDRSDKAGKLLAEALLKGLQGHRPVTLVGFSLGARVIFRCLQILAESEANAAGIVERVVLLGAPVAIKDENWEATRKVVAGRYVNAYSTKDWMLGIAFRASLLTKGLAGIQPVDVPGIENVDVTDIIEGAARRTTPAPSGRTAPLPLAPSASTEPSATSAVCQHGAVRPHPEAPFVVAVRSSTFVRRSFVHPSARTPSGPRDEVPWPPPAPPAPLAVHSPVFRRVLGFFQDQNCVNSSKALAVRRYLLSSISCKSNSGLNKIIQ